MRAKVHTDGFGGKVVVDHTTGDTVISSEDGRGFGVTFEGLRNPDIEQLRFAPGIPFDLTITQSDGWEIRIAPDVYNKEYLIITRFRWSEHRQLKGELYLTKDMKWSPEPKGHKALPDDALRIPLTSDNS